MPELIHTARLTSVTDLVPLLDLLTQQLAWPAKARFQIELALEELVVNTFTHGQSLNSQGEHLAVAVDVLVQQDGHYLYITLTDNAVAFDPTHFGPPDVTSSAEDRKIGGLGLFFASQMMDSIDYHRDGQFNRVKLFKRLPPEPGS